jgi:hypothetical protein
MAKTGLNKPFSSALPVLAPGVPGARPTMFPSSRVDVAAPRREVGRLEDRAAATGWAWDAEVSRRADCLRVRIEQAR